MKRITALILLCALLLTGCFRRSNALLYPVSFYYIEQEIEYGEKGSILSTELHESAGHEGALEDMLYLYFMGPVEENLMNPFPEHTQYLSFNQDGSKLTVELSEEPDTLSDSQFSLACTCLSMTCMEILPVDTVTVTSCTRSITTNRDCILVQDEYMPQRNTRRNKK